MKRVLLTGATGFIGKHAIAPLLERGYEVHAVSTSPRESEELKNLYWHRADLLCARQTEEVLANVRPTHLLHFAWYVEHGKFWSSLENFRWVEASLALLRGFQSQGGRRVVMAGTCAEYDWNSKEDFSETETPLIPRMTYGVCKNSLRILAEEFARSSGLSFAWGRIFFLYGEDEPPNRLIPSVVRSLLKKELAECTHGNQVRDFLYVKDVADAFVALLDSAVEGGVNIASGEPKTIRAVVETIGDLLDESEKVRFGAIPVRGFDPDRIVAKVDRLNGEIGWRPKYTLTEGIQETVELLRKELKAGRVG
jgi:nucleoside-diphosphate-sugar epimerase